MHCHSHVVLSTGGGGMVAAATIERFPPVLSNWEATHSAFINTDIWPVSQHKASYNGEIMLV